MQGWPDLGFYYNDLSEFQREEAGKQAEPKESSHQLAGKRRKGFPSCKALRGAKQLLSCIFLPPCCSGLDVVSLSMDLSEFQQEESGKQEEPKESTHQLAGKRREGFPSKALRGAKQLLSCLFLPPCCSGLDVVYLSMDLSEFQLEEVGKQEEAEESSHQLAFAVGSRQTLSFLMYLDDTEVDVSPVFPEVQFTGSKVRETNDHHLNFLVASDGDNASLPPIVDLLAEFAIVPTLSGRDLEAAFHFHPYHLTTLVRMNPIWVNEVAQLSFYTNGMAISFPVSSLGGHQSFQNSFGRAYGSIIVQLYQITSDECEANQVIGPTSSITFPETYSFIYSEEQNFFLFIIMLFEFHMKGKLSVAEMQIKEHIVVKEEVSKDLMQLDAQKSELSRELEGLQKLVRELEDNTMMLMALLSAASQGRECMKKKLLLVEKQVEGYAALNNEASKNLKHLEELGSSLNRALEKVKEKQRVFEDYRTWLDIFMDAALEKV